MTAQALRLDDVHDPSTADPPPPDPGAADPIAITVAGKRYHVGLWWHTTTEERSIALAARAMAKTAGYDLYCVRESLARQYGLAKTETGYKPKTPAAAASIADIIQGSWHGVFETPEGYWYVAVHSDAILPEGDHLYATAQEAKEKLLMAQQAGAWPRTIAPKEFGIDRAQSQDIDRLFETAVPHVLRPVRVSRSLFRFLALAGVLLATAAAGAHFYNKMMNDRLAAQRALELQAKRLAARRNAPPPPPPWTKAWTPREFLTACERAFNGIVLDLPGWPISKATCRPGIAAADYHRSFGTADILTRRLPKATSVQFSPDGNSASLNASLPPPRRHPDPPATTLHEQSFAILSTLQLLGVTANVKSVEVNAAGAAQAPLPGTQGPNAKKILYPAVEFNIVTGLTPEVWNSAMAWPATTLDGIEWIPEKHQWTYKGHAYAASAFAQAAQANPQTVKPQEPRKGRQQP